ncbi:MAG: hypothetical protein AB1297_05305 [bacterium]
MFKMGFIIALLIISLNAYCDPIKEARAAYSRGDFKGASLFYKEGLSKKKSLEILFFLADSLKNEGNLSSFKEIKLDPPSSYLRDGIYFYHKGMYEKAEVLFKKAGNSYGYVGMALCRKARGDFRKAEKYLILAKELSFQNPLAYINLVNIYSLFGEDEKKHKVFKEGLKNTKSPLLLFEFAKSLAYQGLLSESYNILQKLHQAEPDNLFYKEELVKVLLARGKEKHKKHQHTHGVLHRLHRIGEIEKDIFSKIRHSEIEKVYLQGFINILLNFFTSGMEKMRGVLERDKSFFIARQRLLFIYKEVGFMAKILPDVYQDAVSNAKGLAILDVYLAELYMKKGSITEASIHSKNALRKDPNLDKAYFVLGNIYYLENQFLDFFKSYIKGAFLSSSLNSFYFYLGEAFSLRWFPLYLFTYLFIWLDSFILLIITHWIGNFLIRGYPMLCRYIIKKRWILYLYLPVAILFLSSLFISKEVIKNVPLELIKPYLFFLLLYLPSGIILVLLFSLIITALIKWPPLRIYLSFVLISLSIDIAMIMLITCLFPFFIEHPMVYEVALVVALVFRRLAWRLFLFIIAIYWLWYRYLISKGLYYIKEDNLEKARSTFKKALLPIRIIKAIEPTYSLMASEVLWKMTLLYLKKNEPLLIPKAWQLIERSIEEWWPLNHKANFLYHLSFGLSEIMEGKIESAKESLLKMVKLPEFKRKIPFIHVLLEAINRDDFLKLKRDERGKYLFSLLVDLK